MRRVSNSIDTNGAPVPFPPLASFPSSPSHPQQQRRLADQATTTTRRRIFLILKRAANWASLLCLVDCTILPLLSLLLPLVGWVHAGSTTATTTTLCADWVHTLSLYVVVPTGTATVIWNYWTGHRTRWVAAMGLVGIVLVGWTNRPHHHHHHHYSLLLGHDGSALYQFLHLMGSLLLLGCNIVSQQWLGCDCGIPFCRPPLFRQKKKTTSNKHPLLVVPLTLSITGTRTISSTTTTTTTTAMSLQTQMIRHKQQQQHQQQQRVSLPSNQQKVVENV